MNICSQKIGFREIIYNSLQHKLFSSGVPIQISVYDDKLYVWNDGELPKTITQENLFEKHASRPSNPKIAQTFFKAGFVESWGRGFEKIKEECIKYGTPMPEVSENTGGVMIKCIPSENYLNLLYGMQNKEKTPQNMHNTIKKVTKLQTRILAKMEENPIITQVDLAKVLRVSRQTIYSNVKKLKENNMIERTGSKKKGKWKIMK